MNEFSIIILLAGVVAGATPIVLATLGETLTEKAGLINLSIDGSILLSAMTAFAIAFQSNSLFLGFAAGACTGAIVAAIVALFSVYLNQSQVAVGFVLTLMTRDLAYFIGNPYSRIQGPQVSSFGIPLLKDIPFVGQIFFNHNWLVYLSLVLIFGIWWYFYHTSWGLRLRAVGEHPQAVFARGIDPKKVQLYYAIAGGLLVGLAGATFSLLTKPGWGRPQGAEGTGWIVLALVIFGGWHPLKAAAGAYLFSFLQVSGIYLQSWFTSIPSQVFQVAPFPLMIFTLLLMNLCQKKTVLIYAEKRIWLKSIIKLLAGKSPANLGKSCGAG